MTLEQFIDREVATWGEDYIFNLIDLGFSPVLVVSSEGREKWSWVVPSITHGSLEPHRPLESRA